MTILFNRVDKNVKNCIRMEMMKKLIFQKINSPHRDNLLEHIYKDGKNFEGCCSAPHEACRLLLGSQFVLDLSLGLLRSAALFVTDIVDLSSSVQQNTQHD